MPSSSKLNVSCLQVWEKGDLKLEQLAHGLYFKLSSLGLPTFQVLQEMWDMNGNLELDPLMIAS